jgi:N-acetylglutamate synthase-like GNAT family acetyltransferase
MEITIRQAAEADISRLVEIIRNAFFDVAVRFGLTEANCPKHPSNCQAGWIEQALANGARYFLLESDRLSYGCVALEQAGPEVCYLERLAVLPALQGRGYGRALVDHVLEEARLSGTRQVDIGIIAQHFELKEWYKRIGFLEQRTAYFPHLPFEVLFMSKILDSEPCQQ